MTTMHLLVLWDADKVRFRGPFATVGEAQAYAKTNHTRATNVATIPIDATAVLDFAKLPPPVPPVPDELPPAVPK